MRGMCSHGLSNGMDLSEDECMEIKKGMCRLWQSSQLFWLTMTVFLTSAEVAFEQSKVDQCLFAKMMVNGPLVIVMH